MAIYLQYGSIAGEVTTTGYEKYIEVQSYQWGAGRAVSMPHGGGVSKRESSDPSLSEVTFTKQLDATSTLLLQQCLVGEMDTTAKVVFTRTKAGGETEPFLQYTLTNCAITGYSVSSGGDRPNESLSINFTKIEMKYTAYDVKGKGTPSVFTYDLETRQKSG
jgi:type VI secretion system secreted protein Hcp